MTESWRHIRSAALLAVFVAARAAAQGCCVPAPAVSSTWLQPPTVTPWPQLEADAIGGVYLTWSDAMAGRMLAISRDDGESFDAPQGFAGSGVQAPRCRPRRRATSSSRGAIVPTLWP